MKIPEKVWEEPASPRVLEDAATLRVMEPVPCLRMEPPERLIVVSSNTQELVLHCLILPTHAHFLPIGYNIVKNFIDNPFVYQFHLRSFYGINI